MIASCIFISIQVSLSIPTGTSFFSSSLASPMVIRTSVPRISLRLELGSASTASIGASLASSTRYLTSMPLIVVLPTPPFPANAHTLGISRRSLLSCPQLIYHSGKCFLVSMRQEHCRNKLVHEPRAVRKLNVCHGSCYPLRFSQQFFGKREEPRP